MDNIYSVFVVAIPAFAVFAAVSAAAKSAERVCLARWNVQEAKKEARLDWDARVVAEQELDSTRKELSRVATELQRTKIELEKMKTLPAPRARF